MSASIKAVVFTIFVNQRLTGVCQRGIDNAFGRRQRFFRETRDPLR